ncbi:uncharacterized protein LOC113358029 [Papaver somniferum]|uniref:uncharacterized protein LOC113358029 n=1 Tax=Papaver somniferum TaxID=3469 RepID=UPI000E704F88|nr:uncharacterized protein LOC113358029 [Papaver somniferum]XP_026457318.1 uncharacterized protein LOC113358029 [Papaver somniferum]XP_026457319.1 uncharacterized protein LOC113358029 [Papaver somniferum]
MSHSSISHHHQIFAFNHLRHHQSPTPLLLLRPKTNTYFAAKITANLAGKSKSNLSAVAPISNHSSSSSSTSTAPITLRGLGLQPTPKLGLFSILFVLSMVFGSLLSLIIVSIPALPSLRRLGISMEKLSKVVSEEVPGTLSSLKLSGLEITELTQQLGGIRQKIFGNQNGGKGGGKRRNQRNAEGGRENCGVSS